MGIPPLSFTGISTFSDDFRTILQRSVAIASVPLESMQYQQADLLTRKQLLTNLESAVAGLAASLRTLGGLGESRALAATSSYPSLVSAAVDETAQPGAYRITQITSVAKAASETTAAGLATADQTAVSADGLLELVVGSEIYTIDLTAEGANNLAGLRDAINALDAGVTASVLDTGDGATPYYLSLTASEPGETTLQLRETAGEPASNILTVLNQGADAVFLLNGLEIRSASNTVTGVIPGVTLTVKDTTEGGEEVAITIGSSRDPVAAALIDMAAAYNAVRDQVNAQVGEAAGLLSGDFLIRQLQQDLRALSGYEGDGALRRLAELGIEFDSSGVMTFDSDVLNGLSSSALSDAFDFLGSETTGLGGFAARFEAVSDPVSGLIRLQQDQYDVTDARLSEQMDVLAARIDYMQSSLALQLQQADVLLAQLEAQQTMLDASLEGLHLALYGRNEE